MPDHTSPEMRHLAEPAPRHVDLFTQATILCGGFMQQFGWVFFAIGSLMAWLFIPASEARFWLEPRGGWQEAPGTIISFESTNASVNDQLVYKYQHVFDLDGRVYTGSSYSLGQPYQVGEEVTVRYRSKAPEVSHIPGTQRAIFPPFVLLVLIFPLVGLGFIIPATVRNLKAIWLLKRGAFTRGKIVGQEYTNATVTINNVAYPVYKYYFEFSVGGRTHTATCRTYQDWKVEDEEEEIILYDRHNPSNSLVFDAAPNMPPIVRGRLRPAPPGKAVYLILPLLGIGINLWFYWYGSPLE
jgi:hypothetical protein